MAIADRMFEEHPPPPRVSADNQGLFGGGDLATLDEWVVARPSSLAGFALVAAALTALLMWLLGPAAILAMLPAYCLLTAGTAIRIRIDDDGLRVHAVGMLPVTGLKLHQTDYAATGEARIPFLGGLVLKSGGALSSGGVLEHAIIRSGPAVVVTGPHRLKVVVSAADTRQARRMAELLNAYRRRSH